MSSECASDPEREVDSERTGTAEAAAAGETAETTETAKRLTLVEAVREGLHSEMARDNRVLVLGEDVGRNGGVFRATEGLYEAFGDDRVIDTPLAESGIVGTAIGLATRGLRPVAEMQFAGFAYPAFDQLVSHAARLRARSRGRFTCPLVMRAPYGAGIRAPEHHSESPEAFFCHQPGLKVVVPSTPADAKGLLVSAIRDPDPVIFLEPKLIYRAFREAAPDGTHATPLGEAAVRRKGADVSVFTWGAMTRPTLDAADHLADERGFDAEVIDLRALSPLDEAAIVESFERTGRGVVVHEAPRTGGLAGEITAVLQDALLYQEAPIERVTGFDTPVPQHALEDYYLPGVARIADGIERVADF
jgi:pyruvate dehydrogenase E1 component beta subunit